MCDCIPQLPDESSAFKSRIYFTWTSMVRLHAERESSREESTRNSRSMCFCPQGLGGGGEKSTKFCSKTVSFKHRGDHRLGNHCFAFSAKALCPGSSRGWGWGWAGSGVYFQPCKLSESYQDLGRMKMVCQPTTQGDPWRRGRRIKLRGKGCAAWNRQSACWVDRDRDRPLCSQPQHGHHGEFLSLWETHS